MRLRVSNQSSTVLIQNVRLSCSLQRTGIQTFPLLFECLIDLVKPESHNNYAFTLMVDVPDTYYLNFQMHYQVGDIPEPNLMRKLNKFDAKSAIKFDSEVLRRDNFIAAQCRLANISSNAVSLQSVELCPSEYFSVQALDADLFVSNTLKPGEIRSFLYMFSELKPVPASADLGRFIMSWLNETGDLGRVVFKPGDLPSKLDNLISWRLDNSTKTLWVEKATSLTLHIRNHSRAMTLDDVKVVLIDSEMQGVLLSALKPLLAGNLQPGSERQVELSAFPIQTGLQVLGGLHLSVSGKKVAAADLQVYVKY